MGERGHTDGGARPACRREGLMKRISYKVARGSMLPGDVIAFGGKGFVSSIIKDITKCNVSHVGIILQTDVPTIDGIRINQIIESTSLGNGFAGVQINRMSVHAKSYDGEVWWLPLSSEARCKLNQAKFFSFLLDQVGKKYDAPQAIGSALDVIPDNREDFDKLFCSELDAAALEHSGVIPAVNASEMTPADVCRLNIYDEPYQMRGELKELF